MVAALLGSGADIHAMRDPTRGGLATTLKEIAIQSAVGISLEERSIPVRPDVAAACEMMGFDPLYVANEGKVVVCVRAEDADRALAAIRQTRYGRQAAVIGEVHADAKARVVLRTRIGGTRIVDMLPGDMQPRIC
jgi:hydrogenase expression/formation protein HypE